MLGGSVKPEEIQRKEKGGVVKDLRITAWEDNAEGKFYTHPCVDIAWGLTNKKRMHMIFGLLNDDGKTSAKGKHT